MQGLSCLNASLLRVHVAGNTSKHRPHMSCFHAVLLTQTSMRALGLVQLLLGAVGRLQPALG